MNISAPFIRRPVATTLLTLALFLSGALAYRLLAVSPLPDVVYPVIFVSAQLPGASPETMASAVATPLERMFGRVAGITQMTSMSQLGSTFVILVFDVNRDIDGAGRDVQAAINAARGQLPSNLPTNPSWHKVNPADAPILVLTLTSDTATQPQMYDVAESILAQKISQIAGVGQVTVGGASLPAVRAEINPLLLSNLGIGLEDVRRALAGANANQPKGALADGLHMSILNDNDQLFLAKQYAPLIIAYRKGAPVRLSDVATVVDAQEDMRNAGSVNGRPSVLLVISRQPQANIIDTVDRVMAVMPQLQTSIPPSIHLGVGVDRTTTIRASVHDIEITLVVSVLLVILVVFAFLRSVWATAIPSIAVPLSLVGTFGVMYLAGFNIDNLSLMALTISTGFVVDDAIVVMENITRYIEKGMAPFDAALEGSREIGFTVLSMSTSLIAVLLPILLMGGLVGRMFREFAVTLAVAVAISMVVSLTTTPAMCAKLLRHESARPHNFLYRLSGRSFDALHSAYARSLRWVLQHQFLVLVVTFATLCLNVYLYIVVPKGFFPLQDTGRITGLAVGDEAVSFQSMRQKFLEYVAVLRADPAVDVVAGFTGGRAVNTAQFNITLKPLSERKASAFDVVNRLRPQLAAIPGATLYLQPWQDVQIGGRVGNGAFQYTLQGDNEKELVIWAKRLESKLEQVPILQDVNTDLQNRGLEAGLVIDRDTASRLGVKASDLDSLLYDAFGQRQVSVMYKGTNQYHVVMEVDPKFQQDPQSFKNIYVPSKSGRPVPLSAFTHYEPSSTSLQVNHQGIFPAVTITFNLDPHIPLGQAVTEIQNAQRAIGLPSSIQAGFQGAAQAFKDSLSTEPILILSALGTVYIVLGMLYENFIHPITILSTLPSAGVGALLAILVTGIQLDIVSLIGIVLLIGIVKKNAILMIDFAIQAERNEGNSPEHSIYEACLLRFRPITMTTMAALLGGLPIALSHGNGSEIRRPLGIAICGGLIVSQMLTLYTTPVIYLYMDRFRAWISGGKKLKRLDTVPRIPTPADSASD